MKLNYDCIRSVMLTLEKELSINEDLQLVPLDMDKLVVLLPKYTAQDILLSVIDLKEAGYIKGNMQFVGGQLSECVILGITHIGYEFLESVREPHIWVQIKAAAGKIGVCSLSVISEIAKKVISSLLI